MIVAVLGSKGQLGTELMDRCGPLGFAAVSADLPDMDIADPSSVEAFFRQTVPSIVVNAAAYTQVDRAESEEQTAFAVNSKGPELLARTCAELKIPLIHISTDYVFDGQGRTPYKESDPVRPLGVYGRSKAEGEEKLRAGLKEHLIVRTAWLYSPFGQNFVNTMLRLGKGKEELSVVDDQYGSPTCAADLADALLRLVAIYEKNRSMAWGTYHFTGLGVTTWHRFAEAIFEYARKRIPLKVQRVKPIPTAQYPTPAARPGYSVLDCTLIRDRYGITARPWPESLETTLARILKGQESNPSK